jgi:hypothetical protein
MQLVLSSSKRKGEKKRKIIKDTIKRQIKQQKQKDYL